MFDKEKANFYRKFILLTRESFKYDSAKPITQNGITYICFSFHNKEKIEQVNYECSQLTIESFEDHGLCIDEIYRTCINPCGQMPFIFPVYCQECGKIFYARMKHKFKNSRVCFECADYKIKEIIKGDKGIGDISYVYLMHSSATNLLKIGYSTNPQGRASKLETGNGGVIKILNLIRGGVRLEKSIHEMFSKYNIRGEWYQDMPEIREYFSGIKV